MGVVSLVVVCEFFNVLTVPALVHGEEVVGAVTGRRYGTLVVVLSLSTGVICFAGRVIIVVPLGLSAFDGSHGRVGGGTSPIEGLLCLGVVVGGVVSVFHPHTAGAAFAVCIFSRFDT